MSEKKSIFTVWGDSKDLCEASYKFFSFYWLQYNYKMISRVGVDLDQSLDHCPNSKGPSNHGLEKRQTENNNKCRILERLKWKLFFFIPYSFGWGRSRSLTWKIDQSHQTEEKWGPEDRWLLLFLSDTSFHIHFVFLTTYIRYDGRQTGTW